MYECFRALFGPDAFRPLVEYDAVSIGELLTTHRLSFLRLHVYLSFSQRYWWSSSLLGHDAISVGEFLPTFRMSLLPLYSDFTFSRRYWWSLSLLRDMTPYRLANFYRRFRWYFYLHIHGLSSPRKVHGR